MLFRQQHLLPFVLTRYLTCMLFSSPARTQLRILLFGCRMCRVAAVTNCVCVSWHRAHTESWWNWDGMFVCRYVAFLLIILLSLRLGVLKLHFIQLQCLKYHLAPYQFFFFLISMPCLFVWTRSKSLSDIPMVYPVRKGPDGNIINDVGQNTGIASEWNQENKHQCRVAAKDSEAQWQDVSLASCLSLICSMNIYKSIITGQTSSADRSRTATERTLWGELTTLCLNMFMPVNPFLKFEILMSTTKTFLNKKMVL